MNNVVEVQHKRIQNEPFWQLVSTLLLLRSRIDHLTKYLISDD